MRTIGCVYYERDVANCHSAPQSLPSETDPLASYRTISEAWFWSARRRSVWPWLCSISECRRVKFRASTVNSVKRHRLCNVLSPDSYNSRSVSLQSHGPFPSSVTCHSSQATFSCNIFWGELFWVVFIELHNRCHFHSVWICLCIIVTGRLLVWKD